MKLIKILSVFAVITAAGMMAAGAATLPERSAIRPYSQRYPGLIAPAGQ